MCAKEYIGLYIINIYELDMILSTFYRSMSFNIRRVTNLAPGLRYTSLDLGAAS